MPFTYLSHQAPAVALKMALPTRLDGTALVLGSMAPDWAYALYGSRLSIDAHQWPWLFAFCVPVTVIAALVVRRTAAALFARLAVVWQPLSELRLLGMRRPPLQSTVLSAAVGALSHAGWDLFTHNYRWGAQRVGVLRDELIVIGGRSMTGANVLQHVSTVLGAAVTIALMVVIVRRGLLRRWHPDVPLPPASAGDRGIVTFCLFAACGTAAGVVWALDAMWSLPVLITRIALATGAGLVLAALLAPPADEPATPMPAPRRTAAASPSQRPRPRGRRGRQNP